MIEFAALPPFDVTLRRSVFLGLDPQDGHQPCWTGDLRDSVGVIAPPGYGKSSGVIMPALMHWDGPVVCTSTRGDLLRFAGDWRRRIAAGRGGDVYVYDPFASEPGVRSLRWTPLAGCQDPTLCYRRAAAMVSVVGRGIADGDHWRAGAATILRCVLHAAATAGLGMVEVRRWLATQDVREPARILSTGQTPARHWGDDISAMALIGERERGSFYSVARNCIDAMADPRVLESTAAASFDVDRFLNTSSTLFIVGPSHYQRVSAPLNVGLIDSVIQRAAELAALAPDGKLNPPLLLALDEIANIAPLETLPALVSEGGGRGTVTVWAAQSLAQLRGRYGGYVSGRFRAERSSAAATATPPTDHRRLRDRCAGHRLRRRGRRPRLLLQS